MKCGRQIKCFQQAYPDIEGIENLCGKRMREDAMCVLITELDKQQQGQWEGVKMTKPIKRAYDKVYGGNNDDDMTQHVTESALQEEDVTKDDTKNVTQEDNGDDYEEFFEELSDMIDDGMTDLKDMLETYLKEIDTKIEQAMRKEIRDLVSEKTKQTEQPVATEQQYNRFARR